MTDLELYRGRCGLCDKRSFRTPCSECEDRLWHARKAVGTPPNRETDPDGYARWLEMGEHERRWR